MANSDFATNDYLLARKFCWRSALAGVVVAFMSYFLLSALGAGIFASVAENMISKESSGAGVLASSAGVFMGLSAVASLFLGSHFALRVSRFSAPKIGVAHGFVVASLFFLAMAWGGASLIGGVTQGAFKMTEAAARGGSELAANSNLQDIVQRAVGASALKSSPREVTEGLIMRLAQGNNDSAKAYLAYQTGLSSAEVDARAAQMRAEFEVAAKEAGEIAARGVAVAGWSIFVLFAVGLVGAGFGGATGARMNITMPLDRYVEVKSSSSKAFRPTTLANERGSAGPYILAWLVGVPGTLLLMIFMLRAIF